MAGYFKLWIEIERITEDEEYLDVTNGEDPDNYTEPVPIGTFNTLEEAVDAAESLKFHFGYNHSGESRDGER